MKLRQPLKPVLTLVERVTKASASCGKRKKEKKASGEHLSKAHHQSKAIFEDYIPDPAKEAEEAHRHDAGGKASSVVPLVEVVKFAVVELSTKVVAKEDIVTQESSEGIATQKGVEEDIVQEPDTLGSTWLKALTSGGKRKKEKKALGEHPSKARCQSKIIFEDYISEPAKEAEEAHRHEAGGKASSVLPLAEVVKAVTIEPSAEEVTEEDTATQESGEGIAAQEGEEEDVV